MQPSPQRHTTRASSQFRKEFAAAALAIRKLDKNGYKWSTATPAKKIDLNGKQTTSQLAFQPYTDMPAQFLPTMQHRNRRDAENEFFEAYLRQKATMRK